MKKTGIRKVGKGLSTPELLRINKNLCLCLSALSKSDKIMKHRKVRKIRLAIDEFRSRVNTMARLNKARSIPQIRKVLKEL